MIFKLELAGIMFVRYLSFFLLICTPTVSFTQEIGILQELDEKIPIKTTGGILFWGDVLYNNGWHIQKNSVVDTYRLLDAQAVQRALGTFDECKNRLNEIQAEQGILPMTGTIVIVLHGYGANVLRTRNLVEWLQEQKTHDYVFGMSYPSTMQSILEHARMLDRVVKNIPPTVKRIDFIGHSLGSIVIRRYLSGPLDEDWKVPVQKLEYRKTFSPDSRIGRFVMLGPPNHGAIIAARLIGNDPIRRFFGGRSGDELGTDWNETEKSLGIPCCPFIVIAGGRENDRGYSSLIPGNDDGVVSTEGTRLEGAEKWMFFEVGHNEMLITPAIFNTVKRFLLTGE